MLSNHKRIAISQPSYLPWIGYFDLIDQVNTFVFLDTVQFEKQSWQQRNRIKTPTGLQWLTAPAQYRGRFGQSIKDVEIGDGKVFGKHLRTIELNYRRSPFFDEFYPPLRELLDYPPALLCDLNTGIIRWACSVLRIKKHFALASELAVTGTRTDLLAQICANQMATEYLSPLGSHVYLLHERKIIEAKGVRIQFQHYVHPEYGQLFGGFIPYVCILDLLFNEGPRSLEVIRSGRRKPYTPEEVMEAHATNV